MAEEAETEVDGGPAMTAESGRRLLRLSVGYMLDQLGSARPIFDILDALIVVAVGQASVAPVSASRELQLRYATYDQGPPDELRRPISINALAQSLRLPFETVRRRLVKLTLLGACQSRPAGVVVPSKVLLAPIHQRHLDRNDGLTADLWTRTSGDLQLDRAAQDDEPVWTGRPLRLLSRVALDYVLRLADQLGEVLGDPVSVAIWAAAFEADGAPLSIQAIARRVQMSHETVRRRVHDMAGEGVFEVSTKGVTAARGFVGSAAMDRVVAGNRRDLGRLFGTLGDFGVITYWEGRASDRAA